MNFTLLLLYVLCTPFQVNSFGVEIEGLIDLGPKWNYEYKLSPIGLQDTTTNRYNTFKLFNMSQKIRKDNELVNETNQNIVIREGPIIHNKSNVTQRNSSVDKHETFNNKEHEHLKLKIHDIDTSQEKEEIKKIKIRIKNVEKKIRNKNKLENLSTQIVNLHLTTNFVKQKINVKKDLRNYKKSDYDTWNPPMAYELSSKKSRLDKKYKNSKRGRLRGNIIEIPTEHKVKEDPKVYDFTIHIFRQSLKVFDDLITKSELDRVKRKIKSLKKSYIEKFSDYLVKVKNYKIKTKLGNRKVVLNTIDASIKILQRLVNQLSRYMDDEQFTRPRSQTVHIFQREVNKEKMIEFIHACKKFGACRSSEDFSDFVIETLGIILQTNNSKVKQASDALTEVVKTTDFTKFIDEDTQNKLRQFMGDMELADASLIRAIFLILRNAIINKNHPIIIMDAVDKELAGKTIAFQDILEIFNKIISKSDNNNSKVWEDIKKDLTEWKDGIRSDILKIFETIITQIKTGLDKMDPTTTQQVKENMRIILKPINIK